MSDYTQNANAIQDKNLQNVDFLWSLLAKNFIHKYGSEAFEATLGKCKIYLLNDTDIICIQAPVLFIQKRLLHEFNLEKLILKKSIKITVGRSGGSGADDQNRPFIPNLNFKKNIAGSPNLFLRGSFFAAVSAANRSYLKRVCVAKAANVAIYFTGQQLVQSDRVIWEAIIDLAKTTAAGEELLLPASKFLKKINRSRGGDGYVMLRHALARFSACCVEVSCNDYTYADNLLRFERCEDAEIYKISLNPQIIKLYDNGWTATSPQLINSRDFLTAWLFGFISSHRKLFPTKISTLHLLSGSANCNLRDFKYKIKKSLTALANLGLVESWDIQGELVAIIKK